MSKREKNLMDLDDMGLLDEFNLSWNTFKPPAPPERNVVVKRIPIRGLTQNGRIMFDHIRDAKKQMKSHPEVYKKEQFVETVSTSLLSYDFSECIDGGKIKKKKISRIAFVPKIVDDKELLEAQSEETQKELLGFYRLDKNYQKNTILSSPSMRNMEFYKNNMIMKLQLIEFRIVSRMSSYNSFVVSRKSNVCVDMDPTTYCLLFENWRRECKPDRHTRGEFLIDHGLNRMRVTRFSSEWKGKNKIIGYPTLQNKFWWLREEKDALKRLYRLRVKWLRFEFEPELHKFWILFEYSVEMWTGMDWTVQRNVTKKELRIDHKLAM